MPLPPPVTSAVLPSRIRSRKTLAIDRTVSYRWWLVAGDWLSVTSGWGPSGLIIWNLQSDSSDHSELLPIPGHQREVPFESYCGYQRIKKFVARATLHRS